MIEELKKELDDESNPDKAKGLKRFFKTGKGQYGEGDVFLGISLPELREIAKKYYNMPLMEIQQLLDSKFHEHRTVALIILIHKYKEMKKNYPLRRKIFEFYIRNMHRINNWDLVDISAPNIPGDFVYEEKSDYLRNLARSESLWEKRISIVSTYAFIRNKNFGETLVIADILMKDEHDLIQKAVGWMLREVGKRSMSVLELFLASRYKEMPRTMLRYAIEKFPEETRKKYLKGEI